MCSIERENNENDFVHPRILRFGDIEKLIAMNCFEEKLTTFNSDQITNQLKFFILEMFYETQKVSANFPDNQFNRKLYSLFTRRSFLLKPLRLQLSTIVKKKFAIKIIVV